MSLSPVQSCALQWRELLDYARTQLDPPSKVDTYLDPSSKVDTHIAHLAAALQQNQHLRPHDARSETARPLLVSLKAHPGNKDIFTLNLMGGTVCIHVLRDSLTAKPIAAEVRAVSLPPCFLDGLVSWDR